MMSGRLWTLYASLEIKDAVTPLLRARNAMSIPDHVS